MSIAKDNIVSAKDVLKEVVDQIRASGNSANLRLSEAHAIGAVAEFTVTDQDTMELLATIRVKMNGGNLSAEIVWPKAVQP